DRALRRARGPPWRRARGPRAQGRGRLAGTGDAPLSAPSKPTAAYPAQLQERVEGYLNDLRFAREPATAGLEEAMRYSLLAGGKRIRPVLALATAESVGAEHESVLPLAAALELIHTYSLIVDDILDVTGDETALGKPQGSDERHGKRTYVSVFGLGEARELAAESHRKARAALAETGGRTATLEQITDYILTRDT